MKSILLLPFISNIWYKIRYGGAKGTVKAVYSGYTDITLGVNSDQYVGTTANIGGTVDVNKILVLPQGIEVRNRFGISYSSFNDTGLTASKLNTTQIRVSYTGQANALAAIWGASPVVRAYWTVVEYY